jgi:hypothetical protein
LVATVLAPQKTEGRRARNAPVESTLRRSIKAPHYSRGPIIEA